jgi:hypothetical protein
VLAVAVAEFLHDGPAVAVGEGLDDCGEFFARPEYSNLFMIASF